MKSKKWRLAGILLFVVTGVWADLPLKPIHPDETVEDTLRQRFSMEYALAGIGSIKAYLESFQRLTEAAKGKIPARDLKSIGHTDWETQQMAFANLPQTVEGTLRYQNWLLKKTRHQLATLELKTGQTTPLKTEQARRESEQAEKEFRAFWSSMKVAD